MAIATADLRAVLDIEMILAGDILACQGIEHSMLACLMAQKQKLPLGAIKSLPMGVTIEIGPALDINTRQNLMLGNKLMMEAFSADLTRRKYAFQVLSDTWLTLFGNAAYNNYSLFFEFNNLCIQILPGKVRFIVNATDAAVVQNLFPLAEGIRDPVDDDFIIGINIADTLGSGAPNGNQASPMTIVDSIRQLPNNHIMLPPSTFAKSRNWLEKKNKLMGFGYKTKAVTMQPIFDKLFLFHISAPKLSL